MRDVMRRDFVTVPVDESLDEVIRIMRFARMRHLVVERDGVLVGLVSYRDLQDRVLDDLSREPPGAPAAPRRMPVEAAMVDSPFAISPNAGLTEAASRMCRLHVGCLPVVESTGGGPRLVGLVTETDLLEAAFLLH